jgi:hypothetical protein
MESYTHFDYQTHIASELLMLLTSAQLCYQSLSALFFANLPRYHSSSTNLFRLGPQRVSDHAITVLLVLEPPLLLPTW